MLTRVHKALSFHCGATFLTIIFSTHCHRRQRVFFVAPALPSIDLCQVSRTLRLRFQGTLDHPRLLRPRLGASKRLTTVRHSNVPYCSQVLIVRINNSTVLSIEKSAELHVDNVCKVHCKALWRPFILPSSSATQRRFDRHPSRTPVEEDASKQWSEWLRNSGEDGRSQTNKLFPSPLDTTLLLLP